MGAVFERLSESHTGIDVVVFLVAPAPSAIDRTRRKRKLKVNKIMFYVFFLFLLFKYTQTIANGILVKRKWSRKY